MEVDKCFNCDKCIIELVDDTGYARARCTDATPPKAGRIITRANTTYKSRGDALYGINPSIGEERVKTYLYTRKQRPKWCLLK